MTTARERSKRQRRREIVAAARELMQSSGGLAFSMRTLAERAGVSIATPYNLFGSKQAVLLAVLDDDLAAYEDALGALCADEIEVLFRAVALMGELLAREPAFYRNVLSALNREVAPELRFMVSGPRYVLWKKLLSQATDAGLLSAETDPDAFAMTTSQLVVGHVLEWARGALTLEEMEARNRYGLALALLAIATERSRGALREQMREAERTLQRLWRGMLVERLQAGKLDDEARTLLADQLEKLEEAAGDKTDNEEAAG